MSKNVALITGITGQDGSYLAEFIVVKYLNIVFHFRILHYAISL